jgi:anthranilate synthase/aminodeoxychorismate synthase-like glutamine amidotransferase
VILLIDNYDSFTHNLWQYLRMLGREVRVCRHDEIGVDEVSTLQPALVVLSPGPKAPDQAGICLELVRRLHRQQPILGICLGHQVIGQAFGARVIRAAVPVHGKTCPIRHDGRGCFAGLPSPLRVTRYHSLILERVSIPAGFEISAEADSGEVMGMRHREFPLEGLQFHPEALLTEHGLEMLRNAVSQAEARRVSSC